MNTAITELLDKNEWVSVNSIVFSDGRLTLLEVRLYGDSNYYIAPVLDSTIESYLHYQSDFLTTLDVFATANFNHFEVWVGDGSAEGEGFIFVMDADDNKLSWFAFFENGGPFNKVSVDDKGTINATSSDSSVIWSIPILDPLHIELIYPQN